MHPIRHEDRHPSRRPPLEFEANRLPCLRLTATLCKVALDKRAVRRGKFFLRRTGARSRHRFHGRGWKRFSSKGFVVALRCDTVGGLCGRRHADLSVRAWYIAPSRDVISMEGACEGSGCWESS